MRRCEEMDGARIERRFRRRAERRCFWTRPFGHCLHGEFVDGTLDLVFDCCHCTKVKISLAPFRPKRVKS